MKGGVVTRWVVALLGICGCGGGSKAPAGLHSWNAQVVNYPVSAGRATSVAIDMGFVEVAPAVEAISVTVSAGGVTMPLPGQVEGQFGRRFEGLFEQDARSVSFNATWPAGGLYFGSLKSPVAFDVTVPGQIVVGRGASVGWSTFGEYAVVARVGVVLPDGQRYLAEVPDNGSFDIPDGVFTAPGNAVLSVSQIRVDSATDAAYADSFELRMEKNVTVVSP